MLYPSPMNKRVAAKLGRLKFPKPESRQTEKRRVDRHEAEVIQAVRNEVSDRDGYCRVAIPQHREDRCRGNSEWAHIGDYRRFKTRGMEPEERHTTWGSAMLCTFHHDCYDGRNQSWTLKIVEMTEKGADGPMRFDLRPR